MKKIIKICASLLIISSCLNCSNEISSIPADIEINDFVWKGMNAYYYWQSDVPNLGDGRFSNQAEINNFSASFETPEDIFESVRFQPGIVDRFSWIVDDYVALENAFQGIRLSNGMEFNLYTNQTNSNNVYGVVYYVIPGSDAEKKGVLRGMVFSGINNTQITVSNYRDLLTNAASVNYTLNLADFSAGDPILNGTEINLSKEQLQENPVAITKVFNEGSKKIGYLLYNQFANSFDGQLNASFGYFKDNNITDLIIDLRYNGGGSVRTATYLASMINGTNTGKLFSQEIWNEKVMNATAPEYFLNNFTNQILNKDSNETILIDEPINSLSLQKVYFIISEATASASELIINGMRPYIEVRLVGTKTVGKQVGSVTLYDSDTFGRNGANLNLNHTYAIQPIVLEIKNANSENNPEGYIADDYLPENFGREDGIIDLGVLGFKTDPLLNAAITSIIAGFKSNKSKKFSFRDKPLMNSKSEALFSQEMYIEEIRN